MKETLSRKGSGVLLLFGATLLAGFGLMCGQEVKANRMAVCNPGDSSVTIVDLESMKEIGTIHVGPNPYYPAVSGDGTTLAVTVEGDDMIRYYDTQTLEKVGEYHFGKMNADHLMTLNDGSYAVMADNPGNSVVFLDYKTRDVVYKVSDVSSPHNIQLGISGNTVYVTSKTNPGISIIDVPGKKLRKFIKTDVVPRGLTVSPDEKTLYYGARWISGIFVMDVETEKVRLIQIPLPHNKTEMESSTYHTLYAVNDSIVIGANEGFSSLDVINVKTNKAVTRLGSVSNPSTVSPVPGMENTYAVSNFGDNTVRMIKYDPKTHGLTEVGKVKAGSRIVEKPKRLCFFTQS